MTTIAELFVSLGIKGSDKTLGALADTKKGLGDLKDTSFEAKAAIIGAMYALERLFATSGHAGTELTNFNALMGGGMVQTLQRYQYAARQVGVSNEAVEGSFKSLQSAMTKTLMGQGAPAGLARVARLTGGITAEDVKRYAEHPELLIQRLQAYAQRETEAGLRNETLKSFGLGDDMISAMTRNAFRPEVLAKAPTYSDKEVGALDKANVAWSNLGNKIEMAVGHFNALHGGQLVGDISKIVDEVMKLAEAFVHLSDKVHLFKAIELAIQGWIKLFKVIEDIVDGIAPTIETIGKVIDKSLDAANETPAEADRPGSATNQLKSGAASFVGDLIKNMPAASKANNAAVDSFEEAQRADANRVINGWMESLATMLAQKMLPNAPAGSGNGGSTQNIEVTQTLNFQHDGRDGQKVADDHKKGIKDAFRQQPALSGGQ